jgi:RND family efflux transporter MFP subunit
VAAVASEQPGTIIEMPVQEGARVQKGDVLFVLSNRLEQLEVLRLRALVESSLERDRAIASLDNAREKTSRMRELSMQEMAAHSDLREAELESQLAMLSLGKVDFERELKRNELQQAEERLAQRTLRSPLEGVVTRRLKQIGEATEELTPVVEVMALDPMWVEFECPIAVENRFRVGNFVRVRVAAGDQRPRLAEITHVSLKASPASHSFLVRATLANQDYSWRSGLKIYVEPTPGPQAAPPKGK